MTRNEFIDEVTTWGELIEFCYEKNLDCCEDVYTETQKDDWFNEEVVNYARSAQGWRDVLSWIEDIPCDGEYYIRDEYDDWREADEDDFDEYKDSVIETGDQYGIWDDDIEELIDEEDLEPELSDDINEIVSDHEPEEACSLEELFESSVQSLKNISVDTDEHGTCPF